MPISRTASSNGTRLGGGIPLTGRVLVEQVPKEILASGFVDGTISVQPYDVSVDTPANKAFVDKFTKKYNEARRC